MMMILLFLPFFFEILKIFGHFAADLLGVAYDLAELIDKRWVFGLNSTINR